MANPKKIVHLQSSKFLLVFSLSFLLIVVLWLLFISLTHIGFPFPQIPLERFFDLGFFSISIFGIIVFLTMAPFQAVEGRLSPIFYSRIFNTPSAHFGLYVLMLSSTICFLVIAIQQVLTNLDGYISQLFIALVAAIIFAILFHRFWVLRCIYQPYIVYKYINTIQWNEEVWLELFECIFKAIKQGRISDAKNLVDLMAGVYKQCSDQAKILPLKEDILSLHKAAQEARPIARLIEEKWPFCSQNK